ncbi:circadian clock protein period [Elysia marginata]|uniref:Circadian clock protein period n=1 Tax=Elysia marginata TaxID=1093978 RepID=A0AAV4G0Z1_9GAST|nr:circadian clock protein period [Elysia marginata]
MFISVSPTSHVVLKASSSLMKYLGYPPDWWKGRHVRDFIKKRDMNSVYACLAQNTDWDRSCKIPGSTTIYSTEGPSQGSSNNCFIRIRRFRRSMYGDSPENTELYCPFHVTLSRNATSSKLSDSDVHGYGKQGRSLTISCTPITTALAGQAMPGGKTFSIRHSAQCSFTYICENTVSILGFFPQDLKGISIFDLYDPEDLPMLMYVHAKIMLYMGNPFKTGPMRLKTRNGHYVTVKTTWTGFVNPLSKTLEFIIARHTVIKAPYNPRLFEEPSVRLDTFFKTARGYRIQEKFLDVLRKPLNTDLVVPPCADKPKKKKDKRKARLLSQCEESRQSTSSAISETPLTNSKFSSFREASPKTTNYLQSDLELCSKQQTRCQGKATQLMLVKMVTDPYQLYLDTGDNHLNRFY